MESCRTPDITGSQSDACLLCILWLVEKLKISAHYNYVQLCNNDNADNQWNVWFKFPQQGIINKNILLVSNQKHPRYKRSSQELII